ncbi:MAG: polyphosphate kinase 2 family protein [Roseiflexaceae bacterium]|nr:polyphosphate kinase 2 family protein [Roseiflexaceae bacterium]
MKYVHVVEPGKKFKLNKISSEAPKGVVREEAEASFVALASELGEIQEELYAAGKHSVLIILQGMDTSGKDGAIRNVLREVSPQGLRVESFKVPTEEELAHDFLWRVHRHAPRKGMLTVFNRSHYEDVLVVRVHKLVGKKSWSRRYDQINEFEELLSENGTIILKFFLHISKQEQEQRLLAREQDMAKAWKLSAGDWQEREHWDDYAEAYEDALLNCSTDAAPWHVVPADQKWFRNLAMTEAIVDRLQNYRKDWKKTLQRMSQERLAELAAFREQASQPSAV